MPYGLAPHVHMTLVNGDAVLLDARTDRYACIAACDAGPIRIGYAARSWRKGPLVLELAAAGYLEPGAGAWGPQQQPAPPERDLHMIGDGVPAIRSSDLIGAAISGLATAWRLRTQRPMHWLRRRPEVPRRHDESVAEAQRFAEARLRLPGLRRCLPHSLALADYLDRRDCPARLVIGVRTHPFEAHCWVQSGPVVLNDTLSRACWYTPIAWS